MAYSIRNESFVTVDAEEHYEGGLFRLYSKSHFMDFVSRATFATSEHPGPMRHHEVVCQDHIVDVVSIVSPQIRRVRWEPMERYRDHLIKSTAVVSPQRDNWTRPKTIP